MNQDNITDEDYKKEKEHFLRIINAYNYYRIYASKSVDTALKNFKKLPDQHRTLLPNHEEDLLNLKSCIEVNYRMIRQIVHNTDHMFENSDTDNSSGEKKFIKRASEMDMDKLKSTLKQIVRDWSEEGRVERDACYAPVIQRVVKHFPSTDCDISKVKVLVPGAGLGRLAFEIAKLGYSCQGNEFSLFMLFASNFILNRCSVVNSNKLYPWVHQSCNNKTLNAQTKCTTFPDVDPSDMPNPNFSMTAGDFLEVYTEPESWDCVASTYFIDTAHNIIEYIETIERILRPGGIWINFGPLLYHFANMPNEDSVELTYEEVMTVIKKMNFIVLEEEFIKSQYTQSVDSMLTYEYNCAFFVVQKPETTHTNHLS